MKSIRTSSNKRRSLLASAVLCLCTGTVAPVVAQNASFPEKPVSVIVPSVPGGLMDTSARLVASKLSNYWDVPVVVENKPGAGGTIGTGYVASAAADGHTLLLTFEGSITVEPLLKDSLTYSVSDFKPLAQVWDTDLVLIVNSEVPASDFRELSTYIKGNPGKLNYPSTGDLTELMAQMLSDAAGWEYVTVMYKGNGDRLRSLMAGETQLALISPNDAVSAIASGRVRPIGIASAKRSSMFPDVPTLDEAGLTNFYLSSWGGLFAPAGTPRNILERISKDARRALAEPDVVKTMEGGGAVVPHSVTPEEFALRIQSDIERWQRLAAQRGTNANVK